MENSFVIDKEALKASTKPLLGAIKASDGIKLAYAAYTLNEPKGCLLFLHGGGAHGLAGYTLMAEHLCIQHHIATYLFDIRGHGRSGGTRGHASTREQVWEDISSGISFLKHEFLDAPIYLGGHSSGAGLVLNYSCWQKSLPVDSYIFVAPEFGYRAPVSHPRGGGDFAKVSLMPIIINRLSGGYFCGDSLAVEFNYSKEMIKGENLLPGYTVNMCRAVTPEDPVSALANLKTFTYILISEKDELIDPTKLKNFLDPIAKNNQNLSFEIIPDGGHLLVFKDAHRHIGPYLSC